MGKLTALHRKGSGLLVNVYFITVNLACGYLWFCSVYQKHATCFLRLWARWCLLYVTHPFVGKNAIVIRSYSQKNFPLQKNEGRCLFPVTVNRSIMLDICRSLKFYFQLIQLCRFTVSSKVGYKIKITQLQVCNTFSWQLITYLHFDELAINWWFPYG